MWFFAGLSQLKHVLKTKQLKGLSAPSITLNIAGNIAWIIYFISIKMWFPVFTNICVLAVCLPLVALLLGNRRKFAQALASIATISPLTSYALINFPSISGWLAMSYNWTASTPQLIKVTRHKHIPGFSEHSIWYVFTATSCVLVYGALIGAKPLIVGAVQGLVYQFVVARYYYRYRNQ